jgi:hypothetical protein
VEGGEGVGAGAARMVADVSFFPRVVHVLKREAVDLFRKHPRIGGVKERQRNGGAARRSGGGGGNGSEGVRRRGRYDFGSFGNDMARVIDATDSLSTSSALELSNARLSARSSVMAFSVEADLLN